MNTDQKIIMLAASFLAAVLPASASLTDGLAAYWTFDTGSVAVGADGIADTKGNSNGTLSGATGNVSINQPGIAGQSVTLDNSGYTAGGTAAYVDLGTAAGAMSTVDQSFTVSIWFKATSNTTTLQTLLNFGNNASDVQGIGFFAEKDDIEIRATYKVGTSLWTGTRRIGLTLPDVLTTGEWHHLTAVFDFEKHVVIGYFDGISSGDTRDGGTGAGETLSNGWISGAMGGQTNRIADITTTGIVMTDSSAKTLQLGVNSLLTQPFPFSGALDEVAVWNRALSAAEVALLYQGQKDGLGIGAIPEPSATALTTGSAAVLVAALLAARARYRK
ncbi:MAG: LamG domain-containing protein [Opitutaceae bacterium]|nr:LamG domain-containing protein [Opitutaceae bacterium]